MSKELKGNDPESGGFARLHRLPAVESTQGAGFAGVLIRRRSLRGVRREGSMAGTYDATQEVTSHGGTVGSIRYTLTRTFDDGFTSTVKFIDGKLNQPHEDLPSRKRFSFEVSQVIKEGFDGAEEFYVTDPQIIAKMAPTERALRELYSESSKNDLDPVQHSGTSYGIFGDAR